MARKRMVQGVENTRRAFKRLSQEQAEAVTHALNLGAAEIEQAAKVLAPVDKGDLRDAIEVRQSLDGLTKKQILGATFGGKALVGPVTRLIGVFPLSRSSPGWYARWVEFGTAINTAQPYIFPAFWSRRRRVVGRIRRAMNRAAKETARAHRGRN